jgi:hypothetical protein
MNKINLSSASGSSSSVPQISGALQTVYSDIHPLFFPQNFTQSLLDSFVTAHDPVLEDNTVFTAPMRLREAALECDSTLRELRRRAEATTKASAPKVVDASSAEAAPEESEPQRIRLDEVRKQRLRARLQSQAGPRNEKGLLTSREQIVRKIEGMREEFEEEMKREEEQALREFKEGLRKAVAL